MNATILQNPYLNGGSVTFTGGVGGITSGNGGNVIITAGSGTTTVGGTLGPVISLTAYSSNQWYVTTQSPISWITTTPWTSPSDFKFFIYSDPDRKLACDCSMSVIMSRGCINKNHI